MEKDLFGPIKEYFEKQGFTCDGEVNDIDLYMEKGDEKAAVELKEKLDFRSVQQAALRQKLMETVYIGIFRPGDMRGSAFRDKLYLLKRLGIGLIVVSKKSGEVYVINEPLVTELSTFQKSNKRKAEAVSKEFAKRRTKNNTGGVRGTKLITGYREDALLVLDALAEIGGDARTTDVKKVSGIEKSAQIMRSNYYGWFENVSKGVYRATDAGYAALEEFEDTIYKLKRG
ncbi:MAG: hypothetical protein IJ796_00915 [Lachnospiraceae bacterium]|nr:hypothetical protein [Lachnospiraceae bacterium]